MQLELSSDEARTLRHAIEVYVSDLREEIVKAEKHDWKAGLHQEETVLKGVIEKLGAD